MKMNEIGLVIGGYTFRGAIKPDSSGNIYVFQAKDLVQSVPCHDVSNLTKISHDIPGYSVRLQKNDVLLVARGMKSGAFRATVFLSDTANVIPSSSIHVIRITNSNILPEYVSHFLNSSEGQEMLSHVVSGSYIGAISRRELEKVDIPIPLLEKQDLIVKLFKNIQDQQKIHEQKQELKEKIINAIFTTLTEK